MNSKKILLIGSEPLRMTRLKRTFLSLKELGYDVEVLSPYQQPKGRPRILTGVIRYLLVFLQVIGSKAHVYHFFNVPDIVGVPLVFKRAAFIYDVRSPWFSSVKETIGSTILSKIAELIERLLTRAADFVLTANTPLAKRAMRWGAVRIAVVPNYPLRSFKNSSSRETMRRELDLGSRPTVLYLGKISELEGSELLKQIMYEVLKRNDRAMFLIVGDGPKKDSLEKFINRNGFSNQARMIDWVAHHEVPNYIAAADVCVLPREHTTFSQYTSPENILKVGEYLALGKPVVAPQMGGFQDAEYPIVSVEPSDMGSAVLNILENPREVEQNSRPTWDISHAILTKVYRCLFG